MAGGTWGDGGYWGDGTLYYGRSNTIQRYIVTKEVLTYHLAIRVNYTATIVPGAYDSMKIHRIFTRTNLDQK